MTIENRNLLTAPMVFDFDDDGQMEVMIPTRAYPIGYLHIFEMDGSEWTGNGWPYALDHVPACTPAVGDVNNDGEPEVVMLSYTYGARRRYDRHEPCPAGRCRSPARQLQLSVAGVGRPRS